MNASDKEQVKQIQRAEKRKRERLLADWKAVLKTREGRNVFNWIFDELQPSTDLWNQNAALMGMKAAAYDIGTRIKAQITEADPDALVTIVMEQRLLEKQETSERTALQLKREKKTEPEEE